MLCCCNPPKMTKWGSFAYEWTVELRGTTRKNHFVRPAAQPGHGFRKDFDDLVESESRGREEPHGILDFKMFECELFFGSKTSVAEEPFL